MHVHYICYVMYIFVSNETHMPCTARVSFCILKLIDRYFNFNFELQSLIV